MSDYDKSFFEGKRPWSRIKDTILGSYMRPYLTHVRRIGNEIVLVDGFAGPGTYGDEHRPGSPLIIESLAHKIVPTQHRSYYINNELRHHRSLEAILRRAGWGSAHAIHGDTRTHLPKLASTHSTETMFVYLDPFGPSVTPYSIVEPLLQRSPSTEILIVVHTPALHRLAAINRVIDGTVDDSIRSNHAILTATFGGEYWKEFLHSRQLTAQEKEMRTVSAYCQKVASAGMSYTGFCPVQRDREGATKYYVVFATRHIKGLQLMNDNMVKAFDTYMTEHEFAETLFSGVSWRDFRNPAGLDTVVLDAVHARPGMKRIAYWQAIIQRHFFKYTESEYKAAVKSLADQRKVTFRSSTGRLNDTAELF